MTDEHTEGPVPTELRPEVADIVRDEQAILERVLARIARDAATQPQAIENLDDQMIELRDAIAEAKEEDVASLIDQMHQVAALSRKRGQGRTLPVDPANPYFGHLQLREARKGRVRDVLIGKRTMLDEGDGLSIVDWRNAPVSRLYYRYEEDDDYEEEFDDRTLEGRVVVRRSVTVAESTLRRISAPQGELARGRDGRWRELGAANRPALQGGVGRAARVPRGQLGVHDEGEVSRQDKHLQEITALIDREQFALITHPDSGVVLIQGGAGSGKTTVALHRVAYLAYTEPRRFQPSAMIIVVFNDALVEYIRHVLPALGVEGVEVTTYRRWSSGLLRRLKLEPSSRRSDATPEAVVRFKKHPAVMHAIDRLAAEWIADATLDLERRVGERGDAGKVLAQWNALQNLAPAVRVTRMLEWVKRAPELSGRERAAAETSLRASQEQVRDLLGAWAELLSDRTRMEQALAELPEEEFSAQDRAAIVRWCTRRVSAVLEWREGGRRGASRERDEDDDPSSDDTVEELRAPRGGLDDLEGGAGGAGSSGAEAPPVAAKGPPALDGEDDALLLRLSQVLHGGIFVAGQRFSYEHVVIDEAQDLCPVEVRVLLDCVSAGKSVTIAGDRAQKMIFDNGFRDWPQLLEAAGLPHVAIQPLKITYRSTRQVMRLARAVLGPLHDPSETLVARDGAAVAYHSLSDMGEAVAFLAEALRNLMQREPSASVALITRYPEQAETYYEALRLAEVPRLRLVANQDFRFAPGIDITDVRQVKGLEFDYVVLLDPSAQNYPATTASRHLLHIAATRTAYQLWLVNSGAPSELLPGALIDSGLLDDAPD